MFCFKVSKGWCRRSDHLEDIPTKINGTRGKLPRHVFWAIFHLCWCSWSCLLSCLKHMFAHSVSISLVRLHLSKQERLARNILGIHMFWTFLWISALKALVRVHRGKQKKHVTTNESQVPCSECGHLSRAPLAQSQMLHPICTQRVPASK